MTGNTYYSWVRAKGLCLYSKYLTMGLASNLAQDKINTGLSAEGEFPYLTGEKSKLVMKIANDTSVSLYPGR